jgi:hypothetical protein
MIAMLYFLMYHLGVSSSGDAFSPVVPSFVYEYLLSETGGFPFGTPMLSRFFYCGGAAGRFLCHGRAAKWISCHGSAGYRFLPQVGQGVALFCTGHLVSKPLPLSAEYTDVLKGFGLHLLYLGVPYFSFLMGIFSILCSCLAWLFLLWAGASRRGTRARRIGAYRNFLKDSSD